MRIAATFITLNEEANLPRALASVDFCDEILVLDSGSTDATVEIARQAGARVERQDFLGYARQKNRAAELAGCDWILSLDADEALSPALRDEIVALQRQEKPAFSAYSFPRRARYAGRWIAHSGWYPDRKIRLYRKDRARWEGDYVHESVRTDGPAGRLQGDLLHYTCDSLAEHLQTLNRYTSLAAQEMHARGRRPTFAGVALAPAWTFCKTYLLKRGFLDGFAGFQIAWTAALYVFAKHAKLHELANRRSDEQ